MKKNNHLELGPHVKKARATLFEALSEPDKAKRQKMITNVIGKLDLVRNQLDNDLASVTTTDEWEAEKLQRCYYSPREPAKVQKSNQFLITPT